ncbi:MAG TPA: DEAD/DEAH box helicase family protein [Nitrososphaeraceae archaeon]|jgi:hypothetical protein
MRKEFRLAHDIILGSESSQQKENTSYLFNGKPFWIWDKIIHEREYLESNGLCCFNHMIGLPEKDGEFKPLFPYQETVYETWEQCLHIWIKKATGLGISEFFLRLMLWLCLRDNQFQYCQMCIVTGPNIDLAKKLMKRMRNMIKDYPGFKFDTETDYVLEINKCWIQAYPSHNLGSFRSLDKPKFIFLDEADFFPVGQLQDVRDVSERYIAKSNPWIVMVSTPNKPGGLFEQIELEPEGDCLYRRIFLDYTHGENLIYTQKDLERARKSPSFEREYNLQYGYGLGNVFRPDEIDKCLTESEYQVNYNCAVSMGIDPGFGSSKFGICILQYEDNIIKVLYAEEFTRPSYENMIYFCNQLRVKYRPAKIFVDGAKPDFIKSLKIQFAETTDYEKIIEQATRDKVDYQHRMYVCPINFNVYGKELLGRFQHIVSKGWILIPKKNRELISQMRTAKFKENGNLDKAEMSNNTYDVFDSVRLALANFEINHEN